MKGLQQVVAELCEKVSAFDADVLTGEQAAAMVKLFTDAERAASTGRLLAVRRVEETSVAKRTGNLSTAQWLANTAGLSPLDATTAVDTSRRLHDCPDTEAALRSGTLSITQASLVTKAAVAAPHMEAELVAAAQSSTMPSLKATCAKVQQNSKADDQRRLAGIHRRRYFRTYTEPDGAVRIDGRITPEAAARLLAKVNRQCEVVFAKARKAGQRDHHGAYMADALLDLVTDAGGGAKGPTRATINVTVDHAALVRGAKESGETCRIDGVGDVPVTTVQTLLADSILKVLVLKDGDVAAVRYIPAPLRTAVVNRDPVCAVPGCDSSFRLEIDHDWERARGGPTSLENLARLCKPHHDMKTYSGFRLLGQRGKWRWCRPIADDPP